MEKIDIKTLAGYGSWSHMINRCINPRHPQYADYGGRGIKVDPRWIGNNHHYNREKFMTFLDDMGAPEAGQTIDRIDNNGNYAPENCRWASRIDQARNTRRNLEQTLTIEEIKSMVNDYDSGQHTIKDLGRKYVRDSKTVRGIIACYKIMGEDT